MTVALVIGFGPFPGAPHNPSAELVARIAKRRLPALADVSIATAILPTSYAAALEELPALLRRLDPDIVLLFGLASRTPYVRVEQRAVNRATTLYADAMKRKYATRALVPGAAEEQHVRADARRLLAAARSTSVDARLSRDAGRYICNAAFYTALAESGRSNRRVAFVHIPRPRRRARLDAKQGVRRPAMESLVRAGAAILGALAAGAKRG